MGQVAGADSRECYLVTNLFLANLAGQSNPYNLDKNTYQAIEAVERSLMAPDVVELDVRTERGRPVLDGKTRWEIWYKTRRCPVDDPDNCTDGCPDNSEAINPWKQYYPTIQTCMSASFSIGWRSFRENVDGRAENIQEHLREAYIQLKTKKNQRYLDALVADIGNQFVNDDSGTCASAVSSASSPQTLKLINTNGAFNHMGLFPVKDTYMRMGFRGYNPIIIGGSYLNAFLESYGLNLNSSGNDQARQPSLSGVDLFVDYDLDTTIGTGTHTEQKALSFMPGTVHVAHWNEYEGANAYQSPTLSQTTIDLGAAFGDPGFMVDQTIRIEECPGEDTAPIIHYQYKLWDDLVVPPQDAFSQECNICWNGKLMWLLDCGDFGCTDILT